MRHLRVYPSAALILAVVAGAAGCGDANNLAAPSATGTLEVLTSTSGVEADPDGYTVQVDAEAAQAIGSSASMQRADIAPGNHTVQLAGIAGNCTVGGENPRSVSITADQTTTVAFEVTCDPTSGGVQISSTTTGSSPDQDGYSITVDGVEQGTLAANGVATLNGLTAGDHLVGLSGVAGNCQVQGDNPRTVTVTPGATVTFAVACTAIPANAATLRLITTTAGPDLDPNGYAFAVDDGTSQPIGVNTTATLTNLAAGSHSIRLSGVAGNCSVAGDNPRSVTLTAGATADVSFVITCTAVDGSSKIAFLSYRDGSYDIFVMNPDGSEPMNLTSNPANDVEPVWSPDGRKLAFRSDREGDLLGDIFVMNADGTGLANLTRNPESDLEPAWSPDGRKIAFVSARNGNFQVFVMNADGSDPKSLTPDQIGNELPGWSPDGTRIAFVRRGRIFLMNADGSGQTSLTSASTSEDDIGFTWSPDGSKIAFIRTQSDENENSVGNLWVMNSDGTNPRNLTNFVLSAGLDRYVNGYGWSPDGSQLVFATGDEIYVIRPDGTGQRNLTNSNDLGEYFPRWSPDGSRISFSALVGDAPDVFVMNADGTGARNLTNNPAWDALGTWKP